MKTTLTLLFVIIVQICVAQGGFVIDHRHTDLAKIPNEYINAAKANLKIRYFRRSHGSQLDLGGMTSLVGYSTEYASKYAFNKTGAGGALFLSTQTSAEPWNSLDFENATWVQITRNYLDDPSNADINVVMWAWSSYFYACSVKQYLSDMEMLISEYGQGGSKGRAVPVTFIFQTACGQRTAERNILVYWKNDSIRKHCMTHNRILFDFNDLECYDPDNNYFGDGNSDGSYTDARRLNDDCAYLSSNPGGSVWTGCRNWGIDWMNSHPTSELTQLASDGLCLNCAHSEGSVEGEIKDNSRLHCVLKGRAAWWMWAVLAGWSEGETPTSAINLNSDLNSTMKNYPNPFTKNTIIEYDLNKNARVKLSIWNSSGQLIMVLVDKNQSKGNYQIPVELDNSKGLYFYTLEIDGYKQAKKMIKM